jgi:hypothetical protein
MNDHRHSFLAEALSFGPFSLFVTGRQLKRADEPIPLGGRALDLLIALVERAGEVVSYNELVSSAWPNVTVYDANLRVQISALRKALTTERTALGTYLTSPVAVIVLSHLCRIRQRGRPPPKEMLTASCPGSCRCHWNGWSVGMKLFGPYPSSLSWDAS